MECAGGHQCGASVQMNQSARVQKKKNGLRNSISAAGRLGSVPTINSKNCRQKCHNKIFRSSSLKLKMKRTSSSSDLADANTVTSSNKKFKQSVTMSSSDSDAVMDGKPAAAEGKWCIFLSSEGRSIQTFFLTMISFTFMGAKCALEAELLLLHCIHSYFFNRRPSHANSLFIFPSLQ